MANRSISNIVRGDTFSKWRIGANVLTHDRTRLAIRELVELADRTSPLDKVLDCPCGAGRMVDLLLDWEGDRRRYHAAPARRRQEILPE